MCAWSKDGGRVVVGVVDLMGERPKHSKVQE